MQALRLDPYEHQFHWDPYPTYAALRERDPVHYNEELDLWFLTRWDDVFAAFRDFRSFVNTGATSLERGSTEQLPYPMFIFSDPPAHTRIRNLFMPLMTPVAVRALEQYIRERTRALLAPVLARGRFDFVADLGCFLPMDVISTLTAVPVEDQDRVRGWADDLIAREDKQHALSERNIGGFINMAQYFEAHSARQAAAPPRHGLLGIMLDAERAGTMSHAQVVGTLILLAIAGNETTTKLIGNMAYRLWQHPHQRRLLRDDPSLIAGAVEETLRFDGSSQIIVRRAGRDVTLRGKTIPRGARVGLCIISANRDPDRYPDPDRYDVRRGARDHLAFGLGIHACLGSALARLEARVVFEEILAAIPDYEIDESGLRRAHNPNVRGFTHVPARFTPRLSPA
ncbi:cytochrome P450 [Solimonas soli]|uniref:cytochrome P450 n=1 Tax=Solimonas soli TaxID=413479 RepID=UPI0004837041|nr:cytochrome P450 [Solimonas soli]